MISLNSQDFLSLNQSTPIEQKILKKTSEKFSNHEQWNQENEWKNTLNNLRLIIQPLILFWLIYPWLNIFPNSNLLRGFNYLIGTMNQFKTFYSSG
jgi:hypothetical protein